ncbi:MAG: F0F1 ATP synthase subunit A [Thermoguttaceae bacterium]|nr:F0F1 ATP synthase subunit A [Thermoguttaceae bacterium]MDW8079691.1 F0F1 ATP synthase subunit A [Thermoguttaceae bacterium]
MLNIGELANHVKDDVAFHVPQIVWYWLPEAWRAGETHPGRIPLPRIEMLGFSFQLTKFMVLEVVAGLIMLLIFVPLAWRLRRIGPPRGRFWNALEILLLFIRDEIVRPAIGGKEADRFLPFVWNLFFFVLICNLLGLVPWAGSPTGAFAVTVALATLTFATVVLTGISVHGLGGYWLALVPHMDVPLAIKVFLFPLILVLEVWGLFIRHAVLAVRLLANIFAGHFVLAVIVGFIAAAAPANLFLWGGVTVFSILGAVAVSLLELLVAFLQAYVFATLSSIFIGMAIHAH